MLCRFQSFLHLEKPFVSLSKSLQSVGSAKLLQQFHPTSKQCEELAATEERVRRDVLPRLEIMADAFDFISSFRSVLQVKDQSFISSTRQKPSCLISDVNLFFLAQKVLDFPNMHKYFI